VASSVMTMLPRCSDSRTPQPVSSRQPRGGGHEHTQQSILNLLIEAPLSVAFNERGNPTGRIFERLKEQHRYWYADGGCVVMTAAMYLLRALHDSRPRRKVRLFEGFVSFHRKSQATSHCEVVEALRAVVLDPTRPDGKVLAPNQLAFKTSDVVVPALAVAGMNFGVPSVVRTSA
jgi:hypothetical protein